MSDIIETFFTIIGCMDGRCQEAVDRFGRQRFSADYPDTITEAGIVGIIATNPNQSFFNNLQNKIDISIKIHNSKGIIVDGHAECAGNPVSDEVQKDNIRESVEKVKELVKNAVPVVGVFVKRSEKNPSEWIVEEVLQ